MRRDAALAAAAALAAVLVSAATGWAQSAPSAEQIVKSLTPTGAGGATRGFRLGPSAGPAQPQAASAPAGSAPVGSAPAVSLSVQFASGSAELSPQAMHVLDNLGRALNDRSLTAFRFRIEGHTDTVGTSDYNKDLSDRRAAAVVAYLASRYHVDRSRVEAIGMGEDGLLVATPDETPEPRNRRVQVVNIGS